MLDAWVVMPNHLHGIMVITDPGGDADQDKGVHEPPSPGANRSGG